MKVIADKDNLFDLLTWHGKGSDSGLVRVSVDEDNGPATIESASKDNGWQCSTLDALESGEGQAAFSVARILAQKKLGRRTDQVSLALDGNTLVSTVGRSTASSPAVPDIPEFWRPQGDEHDPFAVVAEVQKEALTWLLKTGDAMRSNDLTLPTRAATLIIKDGTVSIHATDTYKMGFGQIASTVTGHDRTYYISPSDFLAPLSIMSGTDTVELIESNGHLGLRGAGSIMLRAALAAGPPKMDSFHENALTALRESSPMVLPVPDFADALSGVGMGENGATLVKVNEDHIVISNANSSAAAEGTTTVEVDADVPEDARGASFKFNVANASAALRQARTTEIAMTRTNRMVIFAEPNSPDSETPFIANIALVQ